LFKRIRRGSAATRLLEEMLYKQVAQELRQGIRRDGLWAMAIANSSGVEEEARALYIRYRVQSIKDELEISEALAEEELASIAKRKRILTSNPDYVLCPACNFEQWIGYGKCQRCGIPFSS